MNSDQHPRKFVRPANFPPAKLHLWGDLGDLKDLKVGDLKYERLDIIQQVYFLQEISRFMEFPSQNIARHCSLNRLPGRLKCRFEKGA